MATYIFKVGMKRKSPQLKGEKLDSKFKTKPIKLFKMTYLLSIWRRMDKGKVEQYKLNPYLL